MRDHTGDTITITTDDLDESGFTYSIDTPSPSISSITIDKGYTSTIDDLIDLNGDMTFDFETLNTPVEFEDTMPEIAKIEDMCNDYPALSNSYEKFKSIYAMVHQDWVGRQKEGKG
tara:strand:- start:373 stop:720 length:348 start_codon:yes stop_codon:yes gene_type:complete